MMSRKKKQTAKARKDEHLKLLAQLERLELADSCCDICHCDCYSAHESSVVDELGEASDGADGADDSGVCTLRELDEEIAVLEQLQRIESAASRRDEQEKQKKKKKKNIKVKDRKDENNDEGDASAGKAPSVSKKTKTKAEEEDKNKQKQRREERLGRRRSASSIQLQHQELPTETHSASIAHNQKESAAKAKAALVPPKRAGSAAGGRRRAKSACSEHSERSRSRSRAGTHNTRDCKILQDLLSTLNDVHYGDDDASCPPLNKLSIRGKSKSQQMLQTTSAKADSGAATSKTTRNYSHTLAPLLLPQQQQRHQQQQQLQLCASMANLCLAPTVREAYQRVPTHDKKILNRMAVKRAEQAVAKEHAWLARKYWENERLERELLKVEQVEEYKRAVHDKQFQDYLMTKARLNALAQRDLNELQRLRSELHDKDERAKQRLAALRVERDIQLCQRRCDELRRNEAVNVQQEEQHLDDTIRKRDVCQRLTQRLRRADELRNQMLDGYLKRLQHDNYMEQLQHEEHWRERQQFEQLKRQELLAQIQRKRRQSQRFVEGRQRRHEAITRTAKISASLRELVRQTVTPDGEPTGGVSGDGGASGVAVAASNFYAQNHATLSRLLLDRPPVKIMSFDGRLC